MATAAERSSRMVQAVGGAAEHAVTAVGDFALFAGQTLAWTFWRRPAPRTLMPSLYYVGVRSVPVVAVTGAFIGMVLAVQSYNQFNKVGLATRLGSIINISIVRELGPVLAATMLAGRVGSAIAAELATMRVSEQIDALAVLGAPPVHYLAVPRLLACVLLIPLLTVLADSMGVVGGALICTRYYQIEAHYYWQHSRNFVGLWDVCSGLIKAFFFGAAIALISCHRGFNSRPGAEGVGQAATQAFVVSFVVILVIDFFLAMVLNNLCDQLWGGAAPQFFSKRSEKAARAGARDLWPIP